MAVSRKDRHLLKHAAKLLRTHAKLLQDSEQDSNGYVDSRAAHSEIGDLRETAARLREIARYGK